MPVPVDARYRMLFDTLIEGFCTIEVIFDDAGKAIDYRFLEVNLAFERQTGVQNAQGRRMREIAPNLESNWFELFGKIALTGESARFEDDAAPLGRHFEVCAYRLAGGECSKGTVSPSTPLILLTGWGQRIVAEGDTPAHVDLVLAKPPKLRELRAALQRCCVRGDIPVFQRAVKQVCPF